MINVYYFENLQLKTYLGYFDGRDSTREKWHENNLNHDYIISVAIQRTDVIFLRFKPLNYRDTRHLSVHFKCMNLYLMCKIRTHARQFACFIVCTTEKSVKKSRVHKNEQ